MRVLIGCEFSGVVRDAFAALGHDAWSCDLSPATNGGQHIQGDVLDVLDDNWDLGIFHPTCTYLTGSAEWAYSDPDFIRYPGVGYHQKVKPGTLTGGARRAARDVAVQFVFKLRDCRIPLKAIENPVGALSTRWRKPDQIIQPFQYGDDASKKTALWLIGLPCLVAKPEWRCPGRLVEHNGKIVERWANQTDGGQNKLPPSDNRWADRSVTYQGIANAMASQWGNCP